MKTTLCIILLSSVGFAEYMQGKIDMHGGKEGYEYKKQNNFSKSSFGISMFRDTNTTKSKKPIKK